MPQKKYSSFYLGIGDGFICCSSDLPSIIPLTRKVITLKDGEYIKFSTREYEIRDLDPDQPRNITKTLTVD